MSDLAVGLVLYHVNPSIGSKAAPSFRGMVRASVRTEGGALGFFGLSPSRGHWTDFDFQGSLQQRHPKRLALPPGLSHGNP